MKALFLSFAILSLTLPGMALAMGGDRATCDLIRTGSIVHPHGILACK